MVSSHADTIRDEPPFVNEREALLAENARLEADLALSRNLYDELFAQTEQLRAESQECAKAAGRLVARAVTAEAENQRLRDALRDVLELAVVSYEGDPWYAENEGIASDSAIAAARAALDGTPSAAQTLEDT